MKIRKITNDNRSKKEMLCLKTIEDISSGCKYYVSEVLEQFIKEKLSAENVLGVFGVGMGGYEVYTWACEYPNDMKFIIAGNS